MVSVTSAGNTVQFFYDPDGKRIKKIENGQTTVYVGRDYEKHLNTNLETKYYDALGQPAAMWQTGAGTTYLYRDQLGSTSAASNGSTKLYWPFGTERSSSGTAPTDKLYTGQQWNGSIGLYYYGARFYDPALGRFVSPDTTAQLRVNDSISYLPLTVSYADPALVAAIGQWNLGGTKPPASLDPQLLNRYAYSRNNPTTMYDPTGHWVFVGALVGGAVGLGGYWLSHRDNFQAGEALQWTAVGASVGTGLGLAAELAGLGGVAATGSALAPAAQRGSSWKLPAFQRGVAIENKLGRTPALAQNFPVIDRFENGVATSIRSIDLNAASYQNIGNLTRTVTRYIDTMAAYTGQDPGWTGVRILPPQITGRAVDLVVPKGGWTQSQWDALTNLQQYAQSVGVTLTIIQME